MDQFYQDFNIINNTVNGYSTMKPGDLERKYSAMPSNDYRKRYSFHKRMKENYRKLDSFGSMSTNFDREPAPSKQYSLLK